MNDHALTMIWEKAWKTHIKMARRGGWERMYYCHAALMAQANYVMAFALEGRRDEIQED